MLLLMITNCSQRRRGVDCASQGTMNFKVVLKSQRVWCQECNKMKGKEDLVFTWRKEIMGGSNGGAREGSPGFCWQKFLK